MRCSIGVLELPRGLIIDDINRVGAKIANIKKQARKAKADWWWMLSANTAAD